MNFHPLDQSGEHDRPAGDIATPSRVLTAAETKLVSTGKVVTDSKHALFTHSAAKRRRRTNTLSQC